LRKQIFKKSFSKKEKNLKKIVDKVKKLWYSNKAVAKINSKKAARSAVFEP